MTVDLDALEARAKTRQAIDSPDVLALIAELRQEREQANADVQRLAEAFNENLALKAEIRQERERADALKGDLDVFQMIAGVSYRDQVAALSHAEEAIEKVRNLPRHELNALATVVDAHDIDAIITEYDKQKEAERG